MQEPVQDYQLKAFERSLSEYIATHQLTLSSDDKSAIRELYFHCGKRWAIDYTAKIEDMAADLDLSDLKPELKQLVLDIWTDIYVGD